MPSRPVSSRPVLRRRSGLEYARVLLQRGPLFQILIAAIIPSTRETLFVYLGNSQPTLISISGKSPGTGATQPTEATRDPPNRFQFLNPPRHRLATPRHATHRPVGVEYRVPDFCSSGRASPYPREIYFVHPVVIHPHCLSLTAFSNRSAVSYSVPHFAR